MAANFEQGNDVRPTGSKLDLIQATVAAISQHGLSELTSAKIAGAAGHTAASINFHFGSKEALLLATLREVSEEFAGAMQRVREEAGEDDLRALLGIVDASLGRGLSDSHKIAVWYAFLAESKARGDYQRICGERDAAWSRMVIDLCKRIISARGNGAWPDAEAVAQGLMGLIDQQWQGILFEGDEFDREAARRQCRAYLCSVFSVARAAYRGAGARAPEGDRARRREGPGHQADAAGLGLPQRGVPRARARAYFPQGLAGRWPPERAAGDRRLPDFRVLRPARLRRARQ
jgi:TetR/AcrR family transcriptional repressor of bet genes